MRLPYFCILGTRLALADSRKWLRRLSKLALAKAATRDQPELKTGSAGGCPLNVFCGLVNPLPDRLQQFGCGIMREDLLSPC